MTNRRASARCTGFAPSSWRMATCSRIALVTQPDAPQKLSASLASLVPRGKIEEVPARRRRSTRSNLVRPDRRAGKGIEALRVAASAATLATRHLFSGDGLEWPEEHGHLVLCPDGEMFFRDERHNLVALAAPRASGGRRREGNEFKAKRASQGARHLSPSHRASLRAGFPRSLGKTGPLVRLPSETIPERGPRLR